MLAGPMGCVRMCAARPARHPQATRLSVTAARKSIAEEDVSYVSKMTHRTCQATLHGENGSAEPAHRRELVMFQSTIAENFQSWDKFLDAYYEPIRTALESDSVRRAKVGRTTSRRAFS